MIKWLSITSETTIKDNCSIRVFECYISILFPLRKGILSSSLKPIVTQKVVVQHSHAMIYVPMFLHQYTFLAFIVCQKFKGLPEFPPYVPSIQVQQILMHFIQKILIYILNITILIKYRCHSGLMKHTTEMSIFTINCSFSIIMISINYYTIQTQLLSLAMYTYPINRQLFN